MKLFENSAHSPIRYKEPPKPPKDPGKDKGFLTAKIDLAIGCLIPTLGLGYLAYDQFIPKKIPVPIHEPLEQPFGTTAQVLIGIVSLVAFVYLVNAPGKTKSHSRELIELKEIETSSSKVGSTSTTELANFQTQFDELITTPDLSDPQTRFDEIKKRYDSPKTPLTKEDCSTINKIISNLNYDDKLLIKSIKDFLLSKKLFNTIFDCKTEENFALLLKVFDIFSEFDKDAASEIDVSCARALESDVVFVEARPTYAQIVEKALNNSGLKQAMEEQGFTEDVLKKLIEKNKNIINKQETTPKMDSDAADAYSSDEDSGTQRCIIWC